MPDIILLFILAGPVAVAVALFFGGGRGILRGGNRRAKPLMTHWELTTLRQIRADLPHGYHPAHR